MAETVPGTVVLQPGVTVRLSEQPIQDLIASAREGFRVYELMRLAGPADLVHYLDLELVADGSVKPDWWSNWSWDRGERTMLANLSRPPWAPWRGEPTPQWNAWLALGLVDAAPAMAAVHWPAVEAARAAVRASADPLVRAELAWIDAGEHPNDRALYEPDLSPGVTRYFRWTPHRDYAAVTYPLLEALLAHEAIGAFTHRSAAGDWYAIKLACAEQVRRHGGIPRNESDLFPVHVLTSWSGYSCGDWDDEHRVSLNPFPGWTSGVRFQFEGLQPAGLFLDEGLDVTKPLAVREKQLLEHIVVVLTRYDGGDRSLLRTWFRHPDRLLAGVVPAMVPSFEDLLVSHGFTLAAN